MTNFSAPSTALVQIVHQKSCLIVRQHAYYLNCAINYTIAAPAAISQVIRPTVSNILLHIPKSDVHAFLQDCQQFKNILCR